ncbi:3-deoxy-7-phosphoheptulonate synthase [Pseudomonas aeruginosa]
MEDLLQRVRRCEALQQPEWGDPSRLRDVQAYLRGSPALIRAGDILALRATLARVARGEALVVQCGDCAEDMDDHHAENVARKAAVLELLAGALRLAGRRPVIRVGRIAGQYAKPRSKPHEQVGEQTLPVYRGDMVNGREAHAEQRRADPQRILNGERLPPLVEAVRAAGHPVIWLSDPMHGNTIVAPCGNKTRLVRSIAEEVAAFRLAVSGSGGVAAGLHLETTPDDVTECVADSSGLHQVSRHYTSLCDPRLNPWQALSAVMAWSGAEAIPSATFPLETVA